MKNKTLEIKCQRATLRVNTELLPEKVINRPGGFPALDLCLNFYIRELTRRLKDCIWRLSFSYTQDFKYSQNYSIPKSLGDIDV